MYSTPSNALELSVKNSTTLPTEVWFIPLDILMVICTALVIIFSGLFLFIIIFDKGCHTIPMMLVANSCLSAFVVGGVTFNMCLYTLDNDLRQIHGQDSLCVIRAYLGYASYAVLNFSFFLQAFYRYVIVVYPVRLFWQSFRFQIVGICLTWIFGFVYPLVILFAREIVYYADSQICQKRLHISFSVIYGAFCAYLMPISSVIFIYLKLVRYVKHMSRRVTISNILIRAQRELKMVRRIVILVIILIAVSFPYTVVLFISFFTTPPKYQFRMIYAFVNSSLLLILIALFQFTEPLKTSLMRKIKRRSTRVVPVIT